MNNPRVSAIAAIASGNRALGRGNDLIYKIPEDLKRFKDLTSGHPIIMGRKTFESIGRVLPNRTNIIITRDLDFKAEGAIVVNSIEEALEKAKRLEKEEIFIIGGAQIYQQALPFTDKLYLTLVEGSPEADVYFPDYTSFTKKTFEQKNESNGISYIHLDLEK